MSLPLQIPDDSPELAPVLHANFGGRPATPPRPSRPIEGLALFAGAALVTLTGRSDEQIAAEIGAWVTPSLVALWRSGAFAPPIDPFLALLRMSGAEGLAALGGLVR